MSAPRHRPGIRLVAYTDSEGFGGAEEVVGTLLERLPTDFDVTVMGVSRSTVDRIASRRSSAKTVLVPVISSKRDVRAIARHVRAMRALAPDICFVNLQTPYAGQYGQLAGLLSGGAKVVVTEHSTLGSTSRFRRWLKRRLSARLAAHIGVGVEAARLIEEDAGLRAGSIMVIHNGVPLPPPDERPVRLVPGLVIGSIGRIDLLKGYDVLVGAMSSVRDATLVLVGEGKDRVALGELAAASGVGERVVLTGWRDDGMGLVSGFDVFVLPSLLEGFPLSILEAMQRGRPVVATAVGSVPELVVDGETGFLVPPGDEEALADAVNRLIADEGLRRRLGDAGRERARSRFALDRAVDRYELLFRSLTAPAGTVRTTPTLREPTSGAAPVDRGG